MVSYSLSTLQAAGAPASHIPHPPHFNQSSTPYLQGSLPLRLLAKDRAAFMHFVRVAYDESQAQAWVTKLGLFQPPPPPPFVVFMRGPGVAPEVSF